MLKVDRLCTQYTDAGGRIVKAAQDVSFEVPQGEFFTLLGPSVMRVLHTVGLDHLADREATGLSGGQQQRLALARALTMEPRLLLLDEPLSNLDAKLRDRMRFELKRLQRELNLTTVYVTHDQIEALALSHNIAVMNQGRIVQIGKPEEIYARPRDRFVADFVGTTNFIEGTVGGRTSDVWYRVDTPIGLLQATSREPLQAGARTVLCIRRCWPPSAISSMCASTPTSALPSPSRPRQNRNNSHDTRSSTHEPPQATVIPCPAVARVCDAGNRAEPPGLHGQRRGRRP